MKLVIYELTGSDINQTVVPDQNVLVEAIRPHLYRHNFPVGSLKLQLLTIADDVIAESETVAIEDIGSMDYFHGGIRFFITAYLEKDIQYKIRLIGDDGYIFNEDSYVGWVNAFDLAKYPASSIPNGVFQYPLDFEIWERKVK